MAIEIIKESPEEREIRMYNMKKRYEKKQKVYSLLKFVVYSPLQILFAVISLITKGIAFLSSLSMIYFIAKLVYMFMTSKSVEMHDITKSILFILLPFGMYFLHHISENISNYFYTNKY